MKKVIHMDLKYRQRVTTSIDKNLYKALKDLSDKTKVPQSKLFDKEMLLSQKRPLKFSGLLMPIHPTPGFFCIPFSPGFFPTWPITCHDILRS
jgi:hypothetical protein